MPLVPRFPVEKEPVFRRSAQRRYLQRWRCQSRRDSGRDGGGAVRSRLANLGGEFVDALPDRGESGRRRFEPARQPVKVWGPRRWSDMSSDAVHVVKATLSIAPGIATAIRLQLAAATPPLFKLATGTTLKYIDRPRRRLSTGDSLGLIEEHDRRALANSLGKVKGIPIGKPDAAMRLGFADLFRTGCPMDSITRLG